VNQKVLQEKKLFEGEYQNNEPKGRCLKID
jgi:hypothetical protein